MKIFKREISICYIILVFFCFVSLLSVCWEIQSHLKFNKTYVNMSFSDFQNNWGEPDQIINEKDGTRIFFYKTFVNKFVFKMNNDKVTYTWKENF